ERQVLPAQPFPGCKIPTFVVAAKQRLVGLLGHVAGSTLGTCFSSSIQAPPWPSTAANRSTTVSSTRRIPTPSRACSSSPRSPSSRNGPSNALTLLSPTSSSTVSSPASGPPSTPSSTPFPRSPTTSH